MHFTLELMMAIALCSSKAAIYPSVMIPGNRELPLESVMYSTNAADPPALQIVLAKSEECLAISLIQVAAFFLTSPSLSTC
jgi:hypothetical protein